MDKFLLEKYARLQALYRRREQQMEIEFDAPPPQHEWIPVGEYNGVDLPDTMIDEDYIVWQRIENPEFDCEVTI